jgi:hypothetical protein
VRHEARHEARHEPPPVSAEKKERVLRRALENPTTLPRFWANVAAEPTAAGCRLWIGAGAREGRPTFAVDGHSVQPKRVAWYAAYGTVAAGGRMTPTCGDGLCVEPAHLEWRRQR